MNVPLSAREVFDDQYRRRKTRAISLFVDAETQWFKGKDPAVEKSQRHPFESVSNDLRLDMGTSSITPKSDIGRLGQN